MNHRLRVPHLLLSAVVVASVLSGCGSDGQAQIDFLVFGEPEELKAFRSVVAGFAATDPGFGVRLVEAADRQDLLTRVSSSLAGGNPPDLFLVNYRFYGQFAAKGALQPVDGQLAQPGGLEAADFYPEAMEAFRWKGAQLCVPQNVSSLAVYFNKDAFATAGLPEPSDDWTWDDMVLNARALTTDTNGDGTVDRYGLGVEPGIIRLAPLVWSSGGDLVDDLERPTRFSLDTSAELSAVQDFIDLRARDQVVPSDVEMEAEDLESRFLNGRLAMLMNSRRVVPVLRSIKTFAWDVAPLPGREQRVNVLHSDAYCMTAAADHHDEAWRFMEFALGPEGQRLAAATGRTVPSLREVAESPAFLDPSLPPSRSKVFLDAIPGMRRLPNVSTWPEIEDMADGLLEEALFESGGGEAAEFAQTLTTETEPIFARAER
ncbi:MAG: ABC transporter substrate-binding protein [Acidimicrobiales bacterium]